MGRYVSKTYYNRRLLRIIVRAVFMAAIAVLVLFIVMFFALQKYIVISEDGTVIRLEVPWLMDNPPVDDPPVDDVPADDLPID